MATFSRIKSWVSNEVLTAADLNNEFNNIINNMSPTGIEDASANVSAMQANVNPGGVGTESLATDFLGEIQRLRYVIKRLVGAQWYVNPGRSLAAGGLAIATADIADGAVTNPKKGALGQQVSSVCTIFETNSPTFVDVDNLSVTIATYGRPVFLAIISADPVVNGASIVYQSMAASETEFSGDCAFARDGTVISRHNVSADTQLISGTKPINNMTTPASAFCHIDPVVAGTYTYKVQSFTNSTNNYFGFQSVRLIAYEL